MKDVFIIDAKRTPQAKAGADLKDVPEPFLAVPLLRNILDTKNISNESVDQVILGNTGNPAQYANIARIVALESGLSESIPAHTVHRNCASGLEALAEGYLQIFGERADLVMVGGVESMSRLPLFYSRPMTDLFSSLFSSKTFLARAKALASFKFSYLKPVIALKEGLTDSFCELNMGETAELLSREFNITRKEQDEFANNSHHKAVRAIKEEHFVNEIVPLPSGPQFNKIIAQDLGPRENSSVEGLGKMKPYFERKSGSVTVGNSCPITDGASAILLASEKKVTEQNLKPLGRIIDYCFVGLSPSHMGMGPLVATDLLLKKTGKTLEDIDLFELNEAFAAQVLAVLKGFREDSIAKKFGTRAWGEIPEEKLNVNGGAIALGHPVGSTGCRLVVTLLHELRRRGKRWGIATLCIGGGQGGAVLVENLDGVN